VIKNSLRVKFKNEIAEIHPEVRKIQSENLVEQISKFLQAQTGIWALFSPLNDEPNLLSLVERCPQIHWVFPQVEPENNLSFCHLDSLEQLIASSWTPHEIICEDHQKVSPDKISGCVIPALAYDKVGTRLGRGGGYYDRFLKNFKGRKLGVTFNECLTNEVLPREPHDQIMDIVISPLSWIEVKRNEV
jgi:5-formyltetrahydrofolate cyclo-ligase